jgi:hypothetical protein
MHLCISGPATALADIPEVNELLAGVLACADKVFAQTAIYFPAPALAAAWALRQRRFSEGARSGYGAQGQGARSWGGDSQLPNRFHRALEHRR